MFEVEDDESRIGNDMSQFKFISAYPPHNVYCIALKAKNSAYIRLAMVTGLLHWLV